MNIPSPNARLQRYKPASIHIFKLFENFCRYYLGIRRSQKPCEWIYMSIEALELLKRYTGSKADRSVVSRYAKKYGLLAPKTMRKVSWRLMIQVMPR
uniref:Uncharacterized protein n=1 Tax=Ignisphaera aggregans TaxID=334771 RepID=A0A7J2TAX0_9CREN